MSMRINEVYKNNNNGGGGVRSGHRNRTRGASLSRAEADDIDSANIDLATRNKNQWRVENWEPMEMCRDVSYTTGGAGTFYQLVVGTENVGGSWYYHRMV